MRAISATRASPLETTTSVVKAQLFGVSGHDPLTLGGVTTLLLMVGLLASYVPARRAMRVPPVVALNEG